jgi:hypothetical protein
LKNAVPSNPKQRSRGNIGQNLVRKNEGRDKLRDRGIAFTIYDGFGQDDFGIWSAPGSAAKVAWFTDPDGNVLSLAQSP